MRDFVPIRNVGGKTIRFGHYSERFNLMGNKNVQREKLETVGEGFTV